MATKVIMPQLGESVVEGTVSKWLKREGDTVSEFDPLLEVNTDKVDTEVPAPASGTLLKVLVPEGTTVQAGTLLAVIGQPGEALPEGNGAAGAHGGESHATPAAAPAMTQATPAAAQPEPGPPSASQPAEGPAQAAPAGPPAAAKPARDLGFISPVVARLAGEHNLDLQQVTGTGAGGRITKKDVLAFLEQRGQAPAAPAPAAPPSTPGADLPPWERPGEGDLFRPPELQFAAEHGGARQPTPAAAEAAQQQTGRPAAPAQPAAPPAAEPAGAGDRFIPVEGVRKLIAEHMVRSERTAPHVTTVFEADLSAVLAHQAAHQAELAQDGVKLTLTAYFVAAIVAGLKAVPLVNSTFTDERIILKRDVNVGLAVALDEGLIVPVIRRADELSLLGLARAVNDLATRARNRQLRPDEVQGGTFTLTNHGVSGSLFATPIINQPQTGILGTGIVQKRVVVIDDMLAIRPMVYLTLTFDHRVLDGAVADRFMQVLKKTLEEWAG